MYINYLGKNKLEEYTIGDIVIFPEGTVLRVGIVVELIGLNSTVKRVKIIYGEYSYENGKPSNEIKWIARNPDDCIFASPEDYDLEKAEYLINLYNKINKENIKINEK